MSNIRMIIVAVVIILVSYFTWDTIRGLDVIASVTCSQQDSDAAGSIAEKYFGKSTPCALTSTNSKFDQMIAERFVKPDQIQDLKKQVSDSILRRGIFLDAVVLFTGTFAYLATGNLQSKRKES